MAKWTPAEIPDLTGKTAIVTGASSGIGATAAEALAARGAAVVLAVRSQARGEATRTSILAKTPDAAVTVSLVDLADLTSIRAFCARVDGEQPRVDILINNAGLGMQPKRAVTVDGFERQFATNHLGAFALTGLLLPALLRAPAARVVAIASIAHTRGAIDFDDPQGARRYGPLKAYAQSKLADLMFALELDRRARAANLPLTSVAAHPGVSSTGFFAAIGLPQPIAAVGTVAAGFFGQSAEKGAWPGLYAATMPDVRGGDYWGPDGIAELAGAPKRAKVAAQARDEAVATRLWTMSEEMTGVRYGVLG